MRRRTLLWIGALALILTACQSKAPTAPVRAEETPASRANAALEEGRFADAVALYRDALAKTPENVSLRHGLAVALSYSDRGAAIREFQWVMASAPPGSREAVESRDWLMKAGALPPTPRVERPGQERQTGNSALGGRAVFAEAGTRPEAMRRLQLFLVGQPESPTKEARYVLRTDEDGNFKFPDVVPGPYMLTNRLAGQPIWRLRVELAPAEEKQLELTPSNSVAVRDDFPQGR